MRLKEMSFEDGTVFQQCCFGDNVLQLTDVSRPAILMESLAELSGKTGQLAIDLDLQFRQQRLNQDRNVFCALSKRRNEEADIIQAII